MDNLTHTIIGLIAGESLATGVRETAAPAHGLGASCKRHLYLWIGALGGNLPDADLLLSIGAMDQVKLSYLLNHRGYTHTLPGCLLLAVLLYAGVEIFLRWRQRRPSPRDRAALAGACVAAVLLHLGMDALNSYGVHPFWPWDGNWHYGDSLFIIEPLYWAAAAPLLFVFRSRAARACIALVAIAAAAVSAASGLVSPLPLALLVLLLASLAFAGSRLRLRGAVYLSAGACVLITALFMFAGGVAARRAEAAAAALPGGQRLLDRVLTPAPVNPLCWDVLLLQADDQRYSVRHARLSLAPALQDADRCPDLSGGGPRTAPQTAVPVASTRALVWMGEMGMARAEFAAVAARHCEAMAFMHFARAPFLTRLRGAWVIGDARYDREPGLGFAELELKDRSGAARDASAAQCPAMPPWTAPRHDLLRP